MSTCENKWECIIKCLRLSLFFNFLSEIILDFCLKKKHILDCLFCFSVCKQETMGNFSKDLQTVVSPKFDQAILEQILTSLYNLQNVEVSNILFNFDSKKGDSYLSTVTKFTVEANGSEKSNTKKELIVHLINKALPDNVGRRKTFRSHDFFNNEVIFYNVVWKAMLDFQKQKETIVFDRIPVCISAVADGIHDYVTLEDLTFKGYRSLGRGDGFDMNHIIMVLKLFAQFHGISLAFKDQQPEQFEKIANSLQETYFSEHYRGWYSNFQVQILREVICDAVGKQLPELYSKKLEEIFSNDLYGKIIKCCGAKGRFAVVTHGDAWVPNFLFKYNDNNFPESTYLIDFQLARYGSLALDILFILFSCVDQSLRISHWDSFIKVYHTTIAGTLEKLGSSPQLISKQDILDELKACGIFGFGMAMEAVTMSLVDDDDAVDLDTIQGNEEVPLESVWIVKPFKCEAKRQRLADMFRYMVDSGLI